MANYQIRLGKLWLRMIDWRSRRLKHRNFLIILSVIIGGLAALAAVALKLGVQWMEHQAEHLNEHMGSNWLTALFPLVGVGLSAFFLLRVFRGKLTRGVGFIVNSIFMERSRLAKQHIFGHLLTSAVTMAMGGSVGLEAPIVATGAAIGSNTAQDLRLSKKDTTLLLACGAASGIAAVFNSPIAGVIFALEVLMIDFSIPFFIPLLISTATATVISQILYPDKFVFLTITGWQLQALPFYILLGSICGFVSVYITEVTERVERFFHRKPFSWKTCLMAGIPLCMTIFILPGLYGEGYTIITGLMHEKYSALTAHSFLSGSGNTTTAIIAMCVLLILAKPFSASLTVSAGGNGGVFAPALFIGAITGFLYAFVINKFQWFHVRMPNFIIVAMAGVLGGVMHAPLTAIFLLAEITGGYTLFVPLMIVTAISYFITRKYIKHSLYHKTLVEQRILTIDNNHF